MSASTEKRRSQELLPAPPPDKTESLSKQEAEEDEDESQYLKGRALWLVVTGALLAIFLMALDGTIVANALPPIASAFNALDLITWIPTSFLLTQAPALPIFGQLNTLFSTKWLFFFSIFWFELGSLLSGVATTVEFLIAARAVQGIGAAGIFVCTITMISEIIPLQDRPKWFGAFGGLFVLAGILGPILGGAFVDHVSWRWCFYINLPLAVPTVWFCFQYLPSKPAPIDRKNPPPPREPGTNAVLHVGKRTLKRLTKMDWIGAVLSTGCTTCLVLGLQWGGVEKPWDSVDVLVPLCLCVAQLVAFILWERRRGDTALIPLKLFRSRTMIGSTIAAAFTRLTMFIAIFELPLYFQAVKGHSPTRAGIDMIPITIALVFASGVFGTVTSKFGRFWHIMVIGPLFGIVGYGLMFLMDEHASWGLIIGSQILIGVALGATLQNTLLAVQADLPKDLIPQATSVVTYSQFVGGTIGIAIAGGIFASKLKSGLNEFAPGAPVELLRHSVEALKTLPPEQHAAAVHAYVKALQWCMAPLGCVSCGLTSIASLIIRNVSVKKPAVVGGTRSPKESDDAATVIAAVEDLEAAPRVNGTGIEADKKAS